MLLHSSLSLICRQYLNRTKSRMNMVLFLCKPFMTRYKHEVLSGSCWLLVHNKNTLCSFLIIRLVHEFVGHEHPSRRSERTQLYIRNSRTIDLSVPLFLGTRLYSPVIHISSIRTEMSLRVCACKHSPNQSHRRLHEAFDAPILL